MRPILKTFALCAAMSIPSTAVAQELTADDHPEGLTATLEEMQEHCNIEDNPDGRTQLLAFNEGEEYPFQLIQCKRASVESYNCQTLSSLLEFKYSSPKLLRDLGRDDKNLNRFSDLNEVYDKQCQHLIY